MPYLYVTHNTCQWKPILKVKPTELTYIYIYIHLPKQPYQKSVYPHVRMRMRMSVCVLQRQGVVRTRVCRARSGCPCSLWAWCAASCWRSWPPTTSPGRAVATTTMAPSEVVFMQAATWDPTKAPIGDSLSAAMRGAQDDAQMYHWINTILGDV